ncbi:MAG: carbon-nitrogen hydrolase family protein [Bacillota bacterium]
MAMRLAVAQLAVGEDLARNACRIAAFMEKAARHGVDLVCFPEMSLTGYHPAVLGEPELNARVEAALAELASAGRDLGVGAIVGHGWRMGDALFNRASVLLPDGRRFCYDKLHPTEEELKYFRRGAEILCFPFGERRAGVIICRDQNDPFLARRLREEGAGVLFILAAHYYKPKEARWKVEKNRALPIARAVENKMHVLLANTVGSHLGMVSLGNSLIVDPDGCVVAAAGEAEETLLTLSLDGLEIQGAPGAVQLEGMRPRS